MAFILLTTFASPLSFSLLYEVIILVDLGGTRHYSKSGNESAEEEPKQKVSDEGAGGSLQRVTATSSIKVSNFSD